MRVRALIGMLLMGLVQGLLLGQGARMEFAEPPRLISCEPASSVPCFRMKLNLVDGRGAPLDAELPAPEALAKNMSARAGDLEAPVFYAEAGGASKAATKPRIALVIVDNSGSMLRKLPDGQSRFEAAKQAVASFLDNFQDGQDRVAVVPFESHRVYERIAAARFASTRTEALQQVDALPAPQLANNTALYSAVVYGLETLQKTLKQGVREDAESMVVLLTDGNNEVLTGDDSGLLNGPSGLEQAARAVIQTGVPLTAIGFGGGLDETALRRISTRYYAASDFEGLKSIFSFARTLLNNRITATFASPYQDRASLAGQRLAILARLRLANGTNLESRPAMWSAPQMGLPVYSGKATPEELRAVLTQLPANAGWVPILRPIGVFLGIGFLLLLLWHWVPRLIWPSQYIGVLPGVASQRWASQTRVVDGVIAGRPAPAGFESAGKGVNIGPRGPQDKTVVNPQAHRDFSQTRLDNRQFSPRDR